MKAFSIFKSGAHTPSGASTAVPFTDEILKAAVAAYDPELHEAPIVIGHPQETDPAFGWVKSLKFEDGQIIAEPHQVSAEFNDLVQAGRYKKRSASWYTPSAPNNPKPGSYYLRHVGFLGAQPPAVKGLSSVNFSDSEEGVIEFAEDGMLAGLFRSMREFFIAQFGIEKADQALPNFYITGLEQSNAEQRAAQSTESFSDDNKDDDMKTIEQLTAELATANAEKAAALTAKAESDRLLAEANKQVANFAEADKTTQTLLTGFVEREKAARRSEIEARVGALVTAGKVLPAAKKSTVDFLEGLDDATATVDFSEGDQTKKLTQRAYAMQMLAAGPKIVDFSEAGAQNEQDFAETSAANKISPIALARKIGEVQAEAAKTGRKLSATEAAHIAAGKAAA